MVQVYLHQLYDDCLVISSEKSDIANVFPW